MWGVGLHAACIRVPVGGVERLRQASSLSDPLPTGMGEAASSWDFTPLLSVWLQMLPLPTGCFPACAPHGYDRWRTNMRVPQLSEGWRWKTATISLGSVWVILMVYLWGPVNNLCRKWLNGSKESKKEKSEHLARVRTPAPLTGCRCNNWVWIYSVIVVPSEEKPPQTVFSSRYSGAQNTASRCSEKNGVVFLQRVAFLRDANLRRAQKTLCWRACSLLAVMEYKRTMAGFRMSDAFASHKQNFIQYVNMKDLPPYPEKKWHRWCSSISLEHSCVILWITWMH